MPDRKAIIHIGTPKTGTTSIQEVLSSNRAELIRLGFAYPKVAGERAHALLGAYMFRAAGKPVGGVEGHTGPTDKLGANLQAELNELPDDVRTVIFSSEHTYNQGFFSGTVAALHSLLEPFFSSFQIVVYLRRQDEKAVSLFTQALRGGAAPRTPLPQSPQQQKVFDFETGLRPWIETFGRSSIDVRIFERKSLSGGDVVSDFLAKAGIPELKRPDVTENTSLRWEAQEFLQKLNENSLDAVQPDWRTRPNQPIPPAARPPAYLRDFLSTVFPGRGVLPSRSEAEAFYRSFEATNERVRAMFFPERQTLFDEDFSRYPEVPAGRPTADEVMAVALAVTRMQAAKIAELLSGGFSSKARRALAKGNRARMIHTFIKALKRHPANKPALDELVEAVETPDEVMRVRHFLAGPRIPAPLREVACQRLDVRFGAAQPVGAVTAARKADRQAERRGREVSDKGLPRTDGGPSMMPIARLRQKPIKPVGAKPEQTATIAVRASP